ncbi:MAG: hypothetical protein ABIW16_01195 [Sphingomicrobium sp.]
MDRPNPIPPDVDPAHQAQGDSVRATWADAPPVERPSLRREPPPRPPPTPATDDVLRLRLADELDYARRMLENMGDALSSDSGVVMRHMVQLQSVDIIGQMLGHVAAVIRSSNPDEAVTKIGMCELKARLQRRTYL